MFMTHKIAPLIIFLASSIALAQEFSTDELLGQWVFTSYAEVGSPDERSAVGVLFEFKRGGVLVTKRSSGDVESRYSVDGDTVNYSDARGEQVWKIREFEAGVGIVIENRGTLMYLERR